MGSIERAKAKGVYVGKALARRVVWAPSDLRDGFGGKGLHPPRRLSFVGHGDFEATGREYLEHFKELGGLRPDARILDMGCGIGRMAIPLSGYLTEGSYAGFDVGREMVRWCQRRVSSRHPNFQFVWAPVYNRKYSPFGRIEASEFKFPFPDDSFDFIFATSLFTHLVWSDALHYLEEARRVLKPGGTWFGTFFVIDEAAEREIDAGRASMLFRHPVGELWTTHPGSPEDAIAYRPGDLQRLIDESGLSVREPIHYGRWANRPDGTAGQDIVIAGRAG